MPEEAKQLVKSVSQNSARHYSLGSCPPVCWPPVNALHRLRSCPLPPRCASNPGSQRRSCQAHRRFVRCRPRGTRPRRIAGAQLSQVRCPHMASWARNAKSPQSQLLNRDHCRNLSVLRILGVRRSPPRSRQSPRSEASRRSGPTKQLGERRFNFNKKTVVWRERKK